jgi:hypothetical protein
MRALRLYTCEHVFVTAQGSPEARFWRGVATGKPAIAQSIAFEMRHVGLDHALALLLLVRDVERDRYDAFAARFLTKLRADARASLADLGIATAALVALGGSSAEAGATSLLGLLEALGERRAARVLEDWLKR